MSDLLQKKFLDQAGVATLWGKFIEQLTASVNSEAQARTLADTDLQKAIDDLNAYVGSLPEGVDVETIVAYIDKKTTGIATDAALTELKNALQAIADDYLKTEHKTALEEMIALKADKATFEEAVEALEAEDERIVGLVETETSRAEGAEAALDARLVEVETFFKTAEGESLDAALDTLVEIQKYLDGEGKVADQMLLDIAANKKAIEDHMATNHDFASADAALKAELEGQIAVKADKTTVEGIDSRLEAAEGKVSTLEAEMDAVEAKAAANETSIGTLTTDLEGLSTRVEEALGEGEGSVAEQITNAITAEEEARDAAIAEALTEAKGHTDAEIDKVEQSIETLTSTVDTKAAQADLEEAESAIDALKGRMDKAEADITANAQAIADIIALSTDEILEAIGMGPEKE